MSHPTATLIWFAFRDDADCLVQSVRAARHHAADSRRIIAQDAAAPLPPEIQAQLKELGCKVESDFVDRAGNLNGAAHFEHQLEWFAASGGHADWVVKIDCDTVINAPLSSWLPLAEPSHIAVCALQPTWWFQGCCYAVRAAALPNLRHHLAAHPQALRECAPKFPEDTCLGHLITSAHGPKAILALPGGHASTLFHGLQIAHYDYQTWPPFETYAPFRTLHFGNRTALPKHMPDPVRRQAVAQTMTRYLDQAGIPP